MASNAARNLLILGGVGALGWWWWASMKTAQAASNRAVAPSPTPSQPKQVSTSPTTSTDAGKGSGGTSTGETSTQNERLPEDYRYSASSEPTFEDTSSYFGGTGGIDGGDYGTRG